MLLSGDTAQMDTLHQTFMHASDEIQTLVGTLTGPVQSTTWTGPAAERFRSQWNDEFSPMLHRLQEALQTNGAIVQQRRTALEQASA